MFYLYKVGLSSESARGRGEGFPSFYLNYHCFNLISPPGYPTPLSNNMGRRGS